MIPDYTDYQDEGFTLRNSLLDIQKRYLIEPADLPDFSRSEFELLKYYTNFLNRQTVRIVNTNTYVSFVEVESRVPSKYGARFRKDFQFYVFCFLDYNYGHIIIRKETFGDKLNEFFSHVELDFENDQDFSKKFYVLAKEKNKAVKLINEPFRKEILNLANDDTVIEILNHTILIGDKKTVGVENVLQLLTLGYNLERIRY